MTGYLTRCRAEFASVVKLPKWWLAMPPADQKRYLQRHPNSKFKGHVTKNTKPKAKGTTKTAKPRVVKSKKSHPAAADTTAFMRDFKAATKNLPAKPSVRKAPKEFPGAVELTLLMTNPVDRGKGHGRRTMQALVDMADEQNVPLVLNPNAIGAKDGSALSTEQLEQWYGKFGFEPSDVEYYMIRKPGAAVKPPTSREVPLATAQPRPTSMPEVVRVPSKIPKTRSRKGFLERMRAWWNQRTEGVE